MGQREGITIAAIPARWGSTRFPGKALAPLCGEPMIAHVVRRAAAARSVDLVLVATDDERIAEAAAAAGAEAVMTGECASGTDRIAEAVLHRDGWEVVVNLQGDEPVIAPLNIDVLVDGLASAGPEVAMATLCRPLEPERVEDPNAVKVVRRGDGRALYFSRSVIPHPGRPELARDLWSLHLGIYAFRRHGLERFVACEPSRLELAEKLEQLRALENGLEIIIFDAPKPAYGVDTPEDLELVEEVLKRQMVAEGER
jgi:3-deoxy-manno-octulosonate cytidylyltransferase (CMP-KDO synthetase)